MSFRLRSLVSLLIAVSVASSCKPRDFNQGGDADVASRRNSVKCSMKDEGRLANPAHCEGDMVYDGKYEVAPKALKHYGVDAARFGSIKILDLAGQQIVSRATGKPKFVRDLQYYVSDDQVGVRIIPIVDRRDEKLGYKSQLEWEKAKYPNSGKTANGHTVQGAEELDNLLREHAKSRDPETPVFALAFYIHPENHAIPLPNIGESTYLKTENGITHMAAYIGKGKTRNSPYDYHGQKFFDEKFYPATVAAVSLKGVEQKVLNENLRVTTILLNELNGGPVFPSNYKKDYYRNINLEESLAMFRGWVDTSWVRPGTRKPFFKLLEGDKTYETYCAEHATLLLNVGLNLPQNEQGYVEVFGKQDGEQLWQLVQSRYKEVTGEDMPKIPHFKPLWQIEKGHIKDPTKVKKAGKALAWRAQQTADILGSFINQYGAFPDVGPVFSSAIILGFAEEVKDRMGVDPQEYVKMAQPFILEMFKYDAMATLPAGAKSSDLDGLIERYEAGLKQVLAANPTMASHLASGVGAYLKKEHGEILKKAGMKIDDAWNQYVKATVRDFVRARQLAPVSVPGQSYVEGEPLYVKDYSPPAVLHRIATGQYAGNENVKIEIIGTAMNANETSYHGKKQKLYDMQTGEAK